ncbi:rhodanese-like domain-containing protein [Cerasicoccus fimbriatus]|uniref:rhodanese-like domain-containing protein n=1 Tax=Cerasicoccus fimbriatus TaxID=3014554 RepID=UPI0022B4B847|nr:rhodanese-like domain-containing protein [Cerasicoccus sp. TK19100]
MNLQLIPPAIAAGYLLTVTGIAQTVFLGADTGLPAFSAQSIPNAHIDAPGFVKLVNHSQADRENKRLTEAQFLTALTSGDYVLLDARSASMFNLRHIDGAVNLPLTEFTADTLAAIIPNTDTKILIYCNNNFLNSPSSFATKSVRASLNLHTQASLRAYGYENIYELGPLLDVNQTTLPFAGSEVDD